MYRTATFGPGDYAASDYGGARRPLRLYAQDGVNSKDKSKALKPCTKHQRSNGKLSPGLMVRQLTVPLTRAALSQTKPPSALQVVWCMACTKAIMWSLMADAESPRTLSEQLFTRLPEGAQPRIMYDNACNTLQYMLKREPEFCKDCELYIDAPHFKGHKGCCTACDTSRALHQLAGDAGGLRASVARLRAYHRSLPESRSSCRRLHKTCAGRLILPKFVVCRAAEQETGWPQGSRSPHEPAHARLERWVLYKMAQHPNQRYRNRQRICACRLGCGLVSWPDRATGAQASHLAPRIARMLNAGSARLLLTPSRRRVPYDATRCQRAPGGVRRVRAASGGAEPRHAMIQLSTCLPAWPRRTCFVNYTLPLP